MLPMIAAPTDFEASPNLSQTTARANHRAFANTRHSPAQGIRQHRVLTNTKHSPAQGMSTTQKTYDCNEMTMPSDTIFARNEPMP